LIARNPMAYQSLLNTHATSSELQARFNNAIDAITNAEWENVTANAWACLLLMGNDNLLGNPDPLVRQKQTEALAAILAARKAANDAVNEDCKKAWWNFNDASVCQNPQGRAAAWLLIFFAVFTGLPVAIYFVIKVSGVKNDCLIKKGFAVTPD
jgi:hypothetical protein